MTHTTATHPTASATTRGVTPQVSTLTIDESRRTRPCLGLARGLGHGPLGRVPGAAR